MAERRCEGEDGMRWHWRCPGPPGPQPEGSRQGAPVQGEDHSSWRAENGLEWDGGGRPVSSNEAMRA